MLSGFINLKVSNGTASDLSVGNTYNNAGRLANVGTPDPEIIKISRTATLGLSGVPSLSFKNYSEMF